MVLPYETPFKGNYNFFGVAPPLGLLYIAKILELQGDSINVLDYSAEKFDEQKLISEIHSAEAIGINLMSTSIHKTKNIIQIVKDIDSEIPVIIGGPHCNIFPQISLKETNADICIQGDGEKNILDIRKAILGEKQLSDIPGIFYQINNSIKKGPPYKLIENLDSIPFPARHLVKKYTYGRAYNPNIKKGEFATILTSRGCPYSCKFCSRKAVSLNQFRTRSAENIIEEFHELHEQGYRYIAIMDDAFLSNNEQASKIFDFIINEKIEMKIIITASRVDAAEKEIYKKMKKAGVVSIHYGLESGNQDILDFYNKKTSIEDNRTAVELAHDTGFFTSGTFIFGAPFETRHHFNNTLKFAKSLPLDSVAFLPLKYMVGSDLWSNAIKAKKISSENYAISVDSKNGLGIYTENEILEYCRRAQMSFYYRPKFLYNLLKNSLERNDYSLFKVLFTTLLYNIKGSTNLAGFLSRNTPQKIKNETIY